MRTVAWGSAAAVAGTAVADRSSLGLPYPKQRGADLACCSSRAMALSSAARVPTDGLVACDIGRDVTANADGSWRSRMGVGVM